MDATTISSGTSPVSKIPASKEAPAVREESEQQAIGSVGAAQSGAASSVSLPKSQVNTGLFDDSQDPAGPTFNVKIMIEQTIVRVLEQLDQLLAMPETMTDMLADSIRADLEQVLSDKLLASTPDKMEQGLIAMLKTNKDTVDAFSQLSKALSTALAYQMIMSDTLQQTLQKQQPQLKQLMQYLQTLFEEPTSSGETASENVLLQEPGLQKLGLKNPELKNPEKNQLESQGKKVEQGLKNTSSQQNFVQKQPSQPGQTETTVLPEQTAGSINQEIKDSFGQAGLKNQNMSTSLEQPSPDESVNLPKHDSEFALGSKGSAIPLAEDQEQGKLQQGPKLSADLAMTSDIEMQLDQPKNVSPTGKQIEDPTSEAIQQKGILMDSEGEVLTTATQRSEVQFGGTRSPEIEANTANKPMTNEVDTIASQKSALQEASLEGQESDSKSRYSKDEAVEQGAKSLQAAAGQALTMLNNPPLPKSSVGLDEFFNWIAQQMYQSNAGDAVEVSLQQELKAWQARFNDLSAKDQLIMDSMKQQFEQQLPSLIRQHAEQFPALKDLYVYQKMSEISRYTEEPADQLKAAKDSVSRLAESLQKSLVTSQSFQSESGSGSKVFSFFMPVVFDEKTMYPAHIHIFQQSQRERRSGQMISETWLRMFIKTDYSGTVNLLFHVRQKDVEVKVGFSDPEAADDFYEWLPDIRQVLANGVFTLQHIEVLSA
ncbi:MAG: hypothetical protein E6713_14690 [Sporomusaceae bacterium]|nr:hypothetical protein [Sporomusaceae bacterium]